MIQYLDHVVVYMTRNDIFPWQVAPNFVAQLLSAPSGPGDCYILKTVDSGEEIRINPVSSDFIAIKEIK